MRLDEWRYEITMNYDMRSEEQAVVFQMHYIIDAENQKMLTISWCWLHLLSSV